MLSWITGSKNGLLEPESGEASFVEPPETPAPVFVVKAFKHAIFGTPQGVTPAPLTFKQSEKPVDAKSETTSNAPIRHFQPSEIQSQKDILSRKIDRASAGSDDALAEGSPTKPMGILMTPGTVTGKRKQVKFGDHVVNNEGKTGKFSRSGLPDDCPGKFPSPFTPKSATAASKLQKPTPATDMPESEKKSASKFKEILDSKNSTMGETKSNSASRARDDSDITSDLNFPVSSSGRYWKEQYETYAARSEAEVKKLIAKNKLAKDYARMKDEEAEVWKSRHDIARKKHQDLEQNLAQQIRTLRENLRRATAENSRLGIEVSLLKTTLDDGSAKPTDKEQLISLESERRPEKVIETRPDLQGAVDVLAPNIEKSMSPVEEQLEKLQGRDLTIGVSPADIWLERDSPRSRLTRRMGRSELRATQMKSSRQYRMAQASTESFDSISTNDSDPKSLREQPSQPDIKYHSSSIPLRERSGNIPSTPPPSIRNKSSDFKLNKLEAQPALSHATIIKLDEAVALDGLDIQASQPTTPLIAKSPIVKGRTPRTKGGTKMEDEKLLNARARIAARRSAKARSAATKGARTWV